MKRIIEINDETSLESVLQDVADYLVETGYVKIKENAVELKDGYLILETTKQ